MGRGCRGKGGSVTGSSEKRGAGERRRGKGAEIDDEARRTSIFAIGSTWPGTSVGPRAGGNEYVDDLLDCEVTPLLLVCPLPPLGARSALMATARPARAFAAVPAPGRVARRVAARAVRSDAAAIPRARRDLRHRRERGARLGVVRPSPRPRGGHRERGSEQRRRRRAPAAARGARRVGRGGRGARRDRRGSEGGGWRPPRPDEAPREDDRAFDADSDAFLFDEPALAAPMSAPARRA